MDQANSKQANQVAKQRSEAGHNQAFSGQLYKNLREIINVIDELRDCGIEQQIHLPRIAVIGTQSSGKTSLLEMIVGIDVSGRWKNGLKEDGVQEDGLMDWWSEKVKEQMT